MTKIAIVILSDTETMESLGKVSNAFMLAQEAIESGDDLKIIFEGAGARWIGALEDKNHKLHDLYLSVKNNITGVCLFCANVFGVKSKVLAANIPLISEYKEHPSLRQLFVEGYQVITF
jgi:hypothetical protein